MDTHKDKIKILFTDSVLELHKDGTYEIREQPIVDENEAYVKRQDKWVRENNLKVGDKVRVIGEADSCQDGWTSYWVKNMDSYVGTVCTVMSFYGEEGIKLKHTCGSWYVFPYFVLEKVEKERTPWTDAQMIDVATMAVLGKRQTLQWAKGSISIVGLDDNVGIVGVTRVDDKVKLMTSNKAVFSAKELMKYNINGKPCYNEEYV